LEQKLTEDECRAAVTAFPTRLYREFAAYLSEKNIKMAVTANNSPLAVKLFFKRWYVKEFGNNIFGRTGPNPEDLKPNTLFLLEAMKKLKVHPDRCLLIGDFLTDYLAAKAAGVPFPGFTYTFDRCVVFLKAGAQLVIKSYEDLLHALGGEGPNVVSTEGEYLYR
jgi:phosphoglycolate phosphatase-like HAD superfamily hydrolase